MSVQKKYARENRALEHVEAMKKTKNGKKLVKAQKVDGRKFYPGPRSMPALKQKR